MPTRAASIASVAIGAGLLGFAPIGMRLSELGPQATAFWRFAFALPLLAALFSLKPELPARRIPILLIAGLCFGLDIAFFHAALGLTTVVNATLASNMTPIIAAAGGWLLFKERVTRFYLVGAGVAFSGAMMLSYARAVSGAGVASGESGLLGDILGLIAAIWYASYLIILRRERTRATTLAVMLVTTFSAALFALCATFVVGEALFPESASGWLVLIGLGIVVHVGGQGLIAYGLGQLPISLSTILLWVQPVAAAGLSWILFGEALTPLAFTGGALVLIGVYLVQRAGAKPAMETAA